MKPENMWAYGLLEDVERDAIRKSDEKEPAVQVYAAIQQILHLSRWVRKEGVLYLDEAFDDTAEDIQSELAGLSILPEGIGHFMRL